ncbi:ATP-dependent DNA helicase chl1 [Collariella sp. IMI 366227]|nr:ATP-dependent DNA helicase chl1 [Collariella sp. IMI 366227]
MPEPEAANKDEMSNELEQIDFHHPYQPYDVQLEFMRAVYSVLEKGNGQVGILESPTGTIYYTSRTHSQLTQFISELRRPTFPPSLPEELIAGGQGKEKPNTETIKQLPLSSRQKLCINPSVARLGSLAAINDRCTELQQSKSKEKCSFMPGAENLKQTHAFRDTALAILPDIEDLHRVGKELQICPYYASRTAIPGAEVITLPYPLLLQKSARDALGIKLEGNVVIIDEAHNIMDAVANVHAAEIRLSELRRARHMLGVYVKRFGKKLKGENRVMVAQVGKVIESLTECLIGQLSAKVGIVEPSSVLKSRGADQINLFKLIRYIQESKLAYKVESYMSHAEQEQEQTSSTASKPGASSPVLHTLVSFLLALTNLSEEGRIFYEKQSASQTAPPDIKLSYLLLSPTHAFFSIASSARAVILAGGTMSPFEDYKAHLFPTLPPEKTTTLSCGHVIPKSNLFVYTLASTRPIPPGSTNGPDPFEFTFDRRKDPTMIRQLGVALLNICSIVPDGVVVFFPSYGYLDEVVAAWQTVDKQLAPGASSQPTLWDRLGLKKHIFRETRGGETDELLQRYSEAILSPSTTLSSAPNTPQQKKLNGALLLSVIGGRLSEGINFSDRLGRCVVVVGLPYPNIHSPDWKARLEYIEATTLSRLLNPPETTTSPAPRLSTSTTSAPPPPPPQKITYQEATNLSKLAARSFYENACLRAVNQSIGRAIRHRNDYAAVVLVDRRLLPQLVEQFAVHTTSVERQISDAIPPLRQDDALEGGERGDVVVNEKFIENGE